MELIVIRHAPAESREIFAKTGKEDSRRPLTPKGSVKMRRVVRGLRTILPDIDVVATSPYARAAETAKIISSAFETPKPVKIEALTPGSDRGEFLSWLNEQGAAETIVAVGHEPDLGMLVEWLLATPKNRFIEFKKGGACYLSWPETKAEAGTAWLRWALTPRQLRALGDTHKKR